MSYFYRELVLLVFVWLSSESTLVAEDHKWVSANGSASVAADFVKLENGSVTLRRTDTGKEIVVPLEKLDSNSRQLAATLSKKVVARKATTAAKSATYDDKKARIRFVASNSQQGQVRRKIHGLFSRSLLCFTDDGASFLKYAIEGRDGGNLGAVFSIEKDGRLKDFLSVDSSQLGLKKGENIRIENVAAVSADKYALLGSIRSREISNFETGIWASVDGKLIRVARSGDHSTTDINSPVYEKFDKLASDSEGSITVRGYYRENIGGITGNNRENNFAVEGGKLVPYTAPNTVQIPPKGATLPSLDLPVPEFPADVRFVRFSNSLSNHAGQSVVIGNLAEGTGGITKANSSGIWAVDAKGQLHLVCRVGDRIGKTEVGSLELLAINEKGKIAFLTSELPKRGSVFEPSIWISDILLKNE